MRDTTHALRVTSTLSWVQGFLQDAERRGVTSTTIDRYACILKRIVNHEHLNLEACTKPELMAMLDRVRERSSLAYYTLHVVVVKMSLRFLGRKDLAEEVPFPKQPDLGTGIQGQVLERQEIERLINEAPTLQDRLIIELLDELGGRRSEIALLRIRDVQFDQYGAIIWLTGKTGTRRRRIYGCVPDLREQINNHPERKDPDVRLFLTSRGSPFKGQTLYRHVRDLGEQILSKKIYPKMFRHTRATEDCRYFTDREMMKLFGWKRPDMVGVYTHLTMQDVEEKDLVLHGLKRKDEILRPISQVVKCVCGQENAPIALYCVGCGALLASEQMADLAKVLSDPKFIQSLINSESFKDALRKALGE